MNIFKTIRFKLTLWYSLLLILLSIIFVVTINIIITNHFKRDPVNGLIPIFVTPPRKFYFPQKWEELEEEKRELIREYRLKDLTTIRQISLLSFIPLTVLSFAGGYIISGQMLKPLNKLNRTIEEITAKNLTNQIDHEESGDEISQLINNFNKMTLRLNTSFKSQKQFVENASHELKTPLAIIQTNLDSAIADSKISQKELNLLLKTAQNSTKFMDKLIEDLLILSILENQVETNRAKLHKILNDSIRQLEVLAKEKNISVKLHMAGSTRNTVIKCNDVLLQRAIMNVIENAIKYSDKNKQVRINVRTKKSRVVIIVKDSGTGIPKRDQKKIFKRFYRVDKSRSRKTGGSGLGLAIAKKIIGIHKGEIKVESVEGYGTKVQIELKTPS